MHWKEINSHYLQLAVIAQGIAARVARKQASSAQAKVAAQKFKPVSYLALDIVDKGELEQQETNSKL